jgi:hypothetical protein
MLRDDGRDEQPPEISSLSLLDPILRSKFGKSDERIWVVQVDAENLPPTFITEGKLEVLQVQVCFCSF